jgi:cytochrome c biogenesis protein CcdA
MTGAFAFAFMAGAIATANPCGFALLPAYFARRLGTDTACDGDKLDAVVRAFAVGAVTTCGFLVMFGAMGGAVALGAYWLTGVLPWAGLVIGLVLAALGLVVLTGRHIGLSLPTRAPTSVRSELASDFLFGIGYGTASLSCTLPIFLAVTGTAITGGLLGSTFSFVAYALGMGTILTALAVAAALTRGSLAAVIGRLLPYAERASGGLLFLAGVYVAYFWGYTLLAPDLPAEGNVIAIGERLSGALRGWLDGTAGRTVIFGLLIVLGCLMARVIWRRTSAKATDRGRKPWLVHLRDRSMDQYPSQTGIEGKMRRSPPHG